MVNPRKAYPVDPAIIPLFDPTTRPNIGHALETSVLLELERRGYETTYVRTKAGFEVDFYARIPGAPTLLIQVCADIHDAATREREVRGLVAAASEHSRAVPLLVTLDSTPPRPALPQVFARRHLAQDRRGHLDDPARTRDANGVGHDPDGLARF